MDLFPCRRRVAGRGLRPFSSGKQAAQRVRHTRRMPLKSRSKTLRELEAEISQAAIRFEKEFMGRGPLETKTHILDDLVLIRLKGVLTPSEMKLAEANDRQRGRYLLKQVRQELIDHGRPLLEEMIRSILGTGVRSLHTDISTRTGERVIVLTLEHKPACVQGTRYDGLDRDKGCSAVAG
jgi:uncharacterized protein YbcI